MTLSRSLLGAASRHDVAALRRESLSIEVLFHPAPAPARLFRVGVIVGPTAEHFVHGPQFAYGWGISFANGPGELERPGE